MRRSTTQVIDILSQVTKDGMVSYHHTSLTSGYIPVGEAEIDLYSGRFGQGIVVKYNNPLSTIYCNTEYYLTDNGPDMSTKLMDIERILND